MLSSSRDINVTQKCSHVQGQKQDIIIISTLSYFNHQMSVFYRTDF